MPTFTTNDHVTLHFTDSATDGRAQVGQETVVLVAGFKAPATTWHFQEIALREAGYRVVGFDRRNHGRSEAPAHGQRLARHGADLVGLLDHLELDAAWLVGGSMGASSIWAHLDLFGFDRCLGMVSVDQTPRMVNDDGWQSGFYGLTPDNVGTFFAEGIPDTGRGASLDKTMGGLMKLTEALGEMPAMGTADDPLTKALLQDHAEADWRDVLRRTERPVLLVAGENSQYWPATHATDLAAEVDLVSAAVIPDCGHAANMDEPEAFSRLLLDFLKG